MLAPSAATLPQGHFLIEPYLYDVIQQGQYDRDGVKRRASRIERIRIAHLCELRIDGQTDDRRDPDLWLQPGERSAEQLQRRDGRRDGAGPIPADKIS